VTDYWSLPIPEVSMDSHEPITLTRDCNAVEIPSGFPTTLPAGTQVRITQSLGGAYTVTTDYGNMVRIAGSDADALGLTPPPAATEPAPAAESIEDIEKLVWDQLRTCYDPEIPVNIVELGLVYSCVVTPTPAGAHRVEVKFTLTAPGCGMGEWLKQDVQAKVTSVPGVTEADVEVVFDPPWNQSMMSDAARLELGML
jgi:probable FeS assembly SUF system protein SufT